MLKLICFMLIGTLGLRAQSLTALQVQQLDALVEGSVSPQEPGLAIGILSKGKIVYERYTGLANLDFKVPIDSLTRFNIASNAKQFTALCILRLAHEDSFALEDDIRSYLPRMLPDHPDTLQIRHLLNHSSGIRDVYNLMALQGKTWWKQEGLSNQNALDLLFQQQELNFAPGTQYLYSNSNYLLLTELVKKVTGKKFADYAADLFSDLGMDHSQYVQKYMRVIPHKARPYANWGKGWIEYPSITNLHGDGGLYMSLRDHLLWEQILFRQDSSHLPSDVLQAMLAPIPGTEITNYGYGLEFGRYKGLPCTYHSGNTGAYNSMLQRFPNEEISILVFSNNGNLSPYQLSLQCAEILLADKMQIPETPPRPAKWGKAYTHEQIAGSYEANNGQVIRMVLQEGQICYQTGQNRPFPLSRIKKNLFAMDENPDWKASFHLEGDKKQMTVYYPGSQPRDYLRFEDWDRPENYLKAAEGRFINGETGAEIKVNYQGDKSYTLEFAGDEIKVKMEQEDLLRVQGFQIRVSRDKSGKVRVLLVDDNRLRNVRFERRD